MKKMVLFLMMVIFMISQVVFGQKVTVLPIMPVVSQQGSYSLEQLKNFILSDRPIVKDWVSDFATSCSEDLMEEDVFLPDTLTDRERSLLIINEYCYLDTVNLDLGFQNSGRDKTGKDNNVIYFTDKRSLKKTVVLRLKYRSIDKVKIKMNCFNLLGGSPRGLELKSKQEKPNSKVDDSWKKKSSDDEEKIQAAAKAYADSIAAANKKAKENADQPKEKHKKTRADRTWAGRNIGWIIPTGAGVVGIVAGFIFPSEGYTWYHLLPKGVDGQGHMSGGIGDDLKNTTIPTTGGNTGSGGGFGN